MLPWDAFLERYRPMARAIAERLNRSSAEAEDLVQEAALALLAALRADTGRFASTEHARNYFLRTVRNLALRAQERRRATGSLDAEPVDPGTTSPEAARLDARRRELQRLVQALPPEDAELIASRFLRRETLARLSARSGIAISTLHNRERALLARLRQALERFEREDASDD